ncbi:MAG: histidine kinase [Chloroflexota bacterium]
MASETLDQFVEQTRAEYDRTQAELREIDILIKQSSAEVDRLTQRNAQITTHVRQLKIDTAPREDIKEGYETWLNIQQRLFTMRGQLEKLQSDQRYLERMANLQGEALAISGVDTGVMTGAAAVSQAGAEAIKVIQSEESARQNLVRRMHDGPASSLSNFILQVEICERLFDSDPQRARGELKVLKDAAASTFSKVKDFIFELRPMMLDDLGVIPTLRSYTNSLQDKSGLDVVLTVTGNENRLESHIEVTIFRAVQQLVNMARSQGQATQITILLDLTMDRISVVVEDNGQGFDMSELESSSDEKMTDLRTLKERLLMLESELIVQSGIGQGTRAEFSIPIDGLTYME